MSKFATRKWIELNYLSGGQYFVDKNVRFETPLLRSDLCDYSYVYTVVKGTITVESNNVNKWKDKKLTLKSNAPFKSHTSKISSIFIGNAEDIDVVMAKYNL